MDRQPSVPNTGKPVDLHQKLTKFFNNSQFEITPMDNGASVRQYFRIHFRESLYFPIQAVILMVVPVDKIEMADDYLNISYYLRRQEIPRPRIFEMQREEGWIFLEPAEGEQLDIYLKTHPEEMSAIYHKLLDFLLEIQKKGVFEGHCPAFSRFFDKEKYLYEFDFHVREQVINHYLKNTFSQSDEEIFQEFSLEVSTFLESTYPVFVHRDFQSSNIFYHEKNSENPFQIIDFQDARSGSYIYDLVSLFWDSYVDIPAEMQLELVDAFYRENENIRKHFTPEAYHKLIDYQVIQRKLHDAGAFVYTYRLLNNQQFLQYIARALEMAISVMNSYPAFMEISQLLQRLMSLPKK